jgi:hypothetical protein
LATLRRVGEHKQRILRGELYIADDDELLQDLPPGVLVGNPARPIRDL